MGLRLSKVVTLLTVAAVTLPAHCKDLFEMSLQELLNIEITTASNRSEKLSDSPATVIVLSQAQILRYGYDNLSEIFDHLPGMEVTRSFGDTSFMNYMRGFRNTFGTPYLVMIDGKTINNIYYNKATQFSNFPISAVERIEIVYGPASSIYGVNAFMGVVNVISRKTASDDNTVHAINRISSSNDVILDYSGFYDQQDIQARFSAKLETGNVEDRVDNNRIYWLQDRLHNEQLWGDFVQSGFMEDEFHSHIRNIALDGYVTFNGFELGLRYLLEDTGYGLTYAADKLPADGSWPIYQYQSYVNYAFEHNGIHWKTELNYQADGADGKAYDLEAWNVTNTLDIPQNIGGDLIEPNESARMIHFQRWFTDNSAYSISQQFDYKHEDSWQMIGGVSYQKKDMQKAYVQAFSGPISPLVTVPELPDPVTRDDDNADNRVTWHESALFLQGKWQVNEHNDLHLGYRFDENSHYGSNNSFRTAYINRNQAWIYKVMYGEAFHAPTPRVLYGGWTGSGSDARLRPEQSSTLEASVRYDTGTFSHLFALYNIDVTDTIVSYRGGARNLGERTITGIDYHFGFRNEFEQWGTVDFKAYATHYFDVSEEVYDPLSGELVDTVAIGDIAKNKLWLVSDWIVNSNLSVSLLGRWIDARKTIASNPVDKIGSFSVVDFNLRYQGWLHDNLTIGLKINNLFDTEYYHPGLVTADSGDPFVQSELLENIGFDSDNPKAWNGSLGWYNSRMPQPNRRIVLSIEFKF